MESQSVIDEFTLPCSHVSQSLSSPPTLSSLSFSRSPKSRYGFNSPLAIHYSSVDQIECASSVMFTWKLVNWLRGGLLWLPISESDFTVYFRSLQSVLCTENEIYQHKLCIHSNTESNVVNRRYPV